MSTPTKEQILREINRTWKPPKDMHRSYFFKDDFADDPRDYPNEFEDVPF